MADSDFRQMRLTSDESNGAKGCIALVDWLWAGHHPALFGLYASAILDLGYDVVPICPRPDQVANLLQASRPFSTVRLHRGYRLQYFAQVRRSIPGAIRPIWATIRHYWRIAAMVAEWESQHARKVDLLFFACIYDDQFRYFRWVEPLLRRPWSGLYIHARSIHSTVVAPRGRNAIPCPQRILKLRSLRSVAVLDEGVVEAFSRLARGKKVVVLPEVTDQRRAPNPWAGVPGSLMAFAAGRPVIGCIGHLQRYKGVLELVRAARDERLAGVCFAFVGEVKWDGYTLTEQQEILHFWEADERAFCHLFRVADDALMNSVIAACDVLYAAYVGFPHSSNILTKAALCRLPVIVSDGYLMAERVREYQLGAVVAEGATEQIAQAIYELLRMGPEWVRSARPRWSAYNAVHSYESLVRGFQMLLSPLSS